MSASITGHGVVDSMLRFVSPAPFLTHAFFPLPAEPAAEEAGVEEGVEVAARPRHDECSPPTEKKA